MNRRFPKIQSEISNKWITKRSLIKQNTQFRKYTNMGINAKCPLCGGSLFIGRIYIFCETYGCKYEKEATNFQDKLKQVEEETTGRFELTCGVNKFDYELGAREAIERLRDITGINKY